VFNAVVAGIAGSAVTENDIGSVLIDCSMKVHTALGAGLLESAYELCLAHELKKRGLPVQRQVSVSVHYDDVEVEGAYKMDLLIDQRVVVELKSVERVLPVHRSQLLSYLRLGGFKLGYLLNFNVPRLRDGIARVVNGL
jgi:GxxExxY protein